MSEGAKTSANGAGFVSKYAARVIFTAASR